MVMNQRFYVACWHNGSPNPYRYYGNITTNHATAEGWLAEAKMKFPEEEWKLCYFYD